MKGDSEAEDLKERRLARRQGPGVRPSPTCPQARCCFWSLGGQVHLEPHSPEFQVWPDDQLASGLERVALTS